MLHNQYFVVLKSKVSPPTERKRYCSIIIIPVMNMYLCLKAKLNMLRYLDCQHFCAIKTQESLLDQEHLFFFPQSNELILGSVSAEGGEK